MDIKATQLKNRVIDETVSSTSRTPAKVSETGKSFVDEMQNLPKIENVAIDNQKDLLDKSQKSDFKNENSFEFVSTTSKDFSKMIKPENLSFEEKQVKHKKAEKELVDEIVLMNNKQSSVTKNVDKNDLNKAQVFVAQKNENQIKDENQDFNLEVKNFENQMIKEDGKNLDFIVPEKLEPVENVENELVVPKNFVADEIIGEPEVLEKFEESVINKFETVELSQNTDVSDKSAENFENVSKKSREFNEIVKSSENEHTDIDFNKSSEKVFAKVETASDKSDVKKSLNNDFENLEQTDNKLNFIKSVEEPQQITLAENVLNKEKHVEKVNKIDKTAQEQIIPKTNSKVVNEVGNVGKVKDIADEVSVKSVEMSPVKPEDIKVIKMEVVNPLAELNNSLNTTKTTDIVNFIDANLTTESTKTAKAKSSKKADAAQKASAEKAIKMTEADAKFFNNLIETNQQVIEGTKTAEQNNNLLKDVETAQSAQVSKILLNALKESQENNKAFRVDFDKDISVILRVNKNGQISAEFLPGDEAVEQYLKANIPLLKQKFNDEGLEYDNLSYRQNKKENNEEREKHNRGNKKENGYE